jgi:hypothetical protein
MSLFQCEWVFITVLVMVIGATQVFYGLRKASGFWLGIGVLMMILPILRIVVVWDYNRKMEEKYGPVEDVAEMEAKLRRLPGMNSTDAAQSATPTPTPVPTPAPRKRSIGSEGWVGRFRDGKGVSVTVTIPPADSPRQRELAAPFAGAKKLGLVGVVVVDNRAAHAVTLDTAAALLHFVDGTQMFAPNPADLIASIGAPEREKELAAYRPPYNVAPSSKLSLGMIFVPAHADLAALDHVRLSLDGKFAEVR